MSGSKRSAFVLVSDDEKDFKVSGQWCYLYRVIDREGNLVDSMTMFGGS